MKISQNRRGVALLVVICALALVIVLFAAVCSSVEMGWQGTRRNAHTQLRAQQSAAFLARLGAVPGDTALKGQKAGLGPKENPVDITRRAPAEGDAVYGPATGLRRRDGDMVLSLTRPDIQRTDEYLINTQGRRPGVVYLGMPGA